MFTNNLIAGAAGNQGGFYEFPIEQSLKFNDNDSSYLSWTPASAGNRKTFTWSGWVKRGNLGATFSLFEAQDTNNSLRFDTSDTIHFSYYDGSYYYIRTNAVYRDCSAWYHIVVAWDTTNATSSDRMRLYVNGERVTSFSATSYPPLNQNHYINNTQAHHISKSSNSSAYYLDGYLAEVNFIDGQALDPTSFGEFKSGVWIPKDPSGLTYGTNGFRLSFQNDTVSEGFNTVTFSSDGSSGSVSGLGFSPDFVWAKSRTNADGHELWDTVRGTSSTLFSNVTEAQDTSTGRIVSFDADGFSYGTNGNMQTAGNFVAWCWDAGSGSPVSNTDGSITSTVKANAAYGFSVVSFNISSAPQTIGHGLNSAPELLIVKDRDSVSDWQVYSSATGASNKLLLNSTNASASSSVWNNTAPTSSVFSFNAAYGSAIAYAFHSVAGYSKVSSFTGTGAANNTITTGFKPAFVLLKNATNGALYWTIYDNTRDTQNPNNKRLFPNVSNAEESSTSVDEIEFTDTGFILNSGSTANQSGATIIYYAVADTRDNAFWRDQSGNGNDWQPNNLTYQDSLPDNPTNNFATFNSIIGDESHTESEGNLKVTTGNTDTSAIPSTVMPSSGKWYGEIYINSNAGNNAYIRVGVCNDLGISEDLGGSVNTWTYLGDGRVYHNGSTTSYGVASTTGDIINVALDLDNGRVWYGKNGTWMSSGDPASNLNPSQTFTANQTMGIAVASGTSTPIYTANFGQDSSFAGNKPAQGNTDDNGIGDFYYAPPSGYLALCTANLPDPVIDPAKDDVPSDYFNTVTYNNTGTSYPKSVTGIGFQPDLIWVKSRTQAYDHYLFDAVRGTGAKKLSSNTTAAEGSDSTSISSFDSDGYTISSGAGIGDITGVTWCWKAGNGTSSNTSGSITSTVSVNQKAGFAAVKWTATSGAQTVGHGLGATPKVVIQKSTSNADDWNVYHASVGSGKYLILNSTAAQTSYSTIWSGVGSSTFPSDTATNSTAGRDYIAYCFAEVEGYSKFGSYTGNGSTDGPMLYLGFEPAFFLAKRIDGVENWFMIDNARHPYNDGNIPRLLPNTSDAEAEDASIAGDFLSNGFKIRATQNMINTSGANYIYMAFAYNPFKFANAR